MWRHSFPQRNIEQEKPIPKMDFVLRIAKGRVIQDIRGFKSKYGCSLSMNTAKARERLGERGTQ
jgi:hypothetical protein